MATPLVMPLIGSNSSAKVNKWVKSEGDKVLKGELLTQLCTAEGNIDYIAPASGTLLKIIVLENTVMRAGSLLGIIGTPGEDLSTIIEPSYRK